MHRSTLYSAEYSPDNFSILSPEYPPRDDIVGCFLLHYAKLNRGLERMA